MRSIVLCLGIIVCWQISQACARPQSPLEPPKLDCYGDPLPPGALARLGSLRLLCENDLAHVVFTADIRIVAAVPRNGRAQFWEVATGRAAPEPEELRLVQKVIDGRQKQWQDTSRRLRAGNPMLTDEDVKLAVESQDGSLIATSSPIRLWDGRTLKELPAWPVQKQERIDSLAFSPDGKSLAGTSPQFTQIWDTLSGKLRHKVLGLGWQTFSSTFSPDGKTLAVADGEVVTLWDLASGMPLHDFGHTYSIGALAFTPDGKSLISGASYTDRFIYQWDSRSGERLATWRGHKSAVYALAMSRDGKQAMSAGYDGTCRLWDVATGREVREIGKHTKPIWSADWAPDGQSVATVDHDQALIWPLDSKKPKQSLNHGGQRVMQVAFSPDGRHLLTRTDEKPGVLRIWDAGNGAEVRRLTPPSGLTISRFSVGRDGRQIATTEPAGTIHLWDFETGWLTRPIAVTIGEMPRSTKWAYTEFSPDGRCLAVGASDGTVRLVELATGQERLRFEGHRRGVTKMLFSPDGTRLASGSWDRTILIWEVAPAPVAAPDDLTPLWADLGGNAPTAYEAMRKLLSAGDKTVALIAANFKAASTVDAKRIAALIADLDSDKFSAREKASRELAALGDAAEAALRKALKESPPLETRRRGEAILAKGAQPSADRLREVRAIETLERLASPAARDLLKELTAGAADGPQSKDAERSFLWRHVCNVPWYAD